jgi:hypothetical protein
VPCLQLTRRNGGGAYPKVGGNSLAVAKNSNEEVLMMQQN